MKQIIKKFTIGSESWFYVLEVVLSIIAVSLVILEVLYRIFCWSRVVFVWFWLVLVEVRVSGALESIAPFTLTSLFLLFLSK